MKTGAVVFVTLFAALSAAATTIGPGDIAQTPIPFCCITTPPPPVGFLLANDTSTKTSLPGAFIVAFGPNNHLIVNYIEYDSSMTAVAHFPLTTGQAAMAVSRNGDVYFLMTDGSVNVCSPAGPLERSFALPFTTGVLLTPPTLDLAADDCTLFYTDAAQNGRRFNVCTGQPLPDLAPGPWTAVRALADGGYVTVRDATLRIFDTNNALVRTVPLPVTGIRAIAFDIDPQFIWLGGEAPLTKVRLATGEYVSSGGFQSDYLAVNGEQRPSLATIAAQNVPALLPSLLAFLACALIALGWWRLR
jgi:hypothetical protein